MSRPIPDLTPDLMRLAGVVLSRMRTDRGEMRLADVPGYETAPARRVLMLDLRTWNGDPHEHDPEGDYTWTEAWLLAAFLADVLARAAVPASKPSPEELHAEAVLQAEIALRSATYEAESAERVAASGSAALQEKRAKREAAAQRLRELTGGGRDA